jgi:hypothetical protein
MSGSIIPIKLQSRTKSVAGGLPPAPLQEKKELPLKKELGAGGLAPEREITSAMYLSLEVLRCNSRP